MKVIEGRAWIDGSVRDRARIVIEDGRFTDVDAGPPVEHGGAASSLLIPGMIDLHVHGADGADFMDADPDAIRRICRAHARHGTTALAATTLSGTRERITAAIRAASAASGESDVAATGAKVVAIHLEGPYIDTSHAGAQDRNSIREPRHAEVEEWTRAAGDLPVIMTVAPEMAGVMELMRRWKRRIMFSVGHTGADFATASLAFTTGAVHATHLFNAMTGLHHRAPGVVGAVLSLPDVTAELIADGRHLHPAVLRVAARALEGRAILVTDAMRACGMPDGAYRLYDYEVQVSDGAARLADGTLAGSVLTMSQAICNMIELAALPLESVIPMATSIPARRLGLARESGRIAPGFRADLVQLGSRCQVERVWIGGEELT